MKTELMYMKDFGVTNCRAKVMQVMPYEDGVNVVLDRTCFYPRGGGQDWDMGTIKGDDNAVMQVNEVRLDEDGVVHHIGTMRSGGFEVGIEVVCAVDEKRRSDNTHLHSAGHLIDMAVDQLQLPWEPGRGAHYPHMSFVEYQPAEGFALPETLKDELQAKVAELSKSNYQNQIKFMPPSEMSTYCRHIPDNLPANKPSRIVLYADDFGIPCGGTHVRRVSEIGPISITKITFKKGIIKVSYRVEGVNN